ncbi:unnamed protein product [Protopolystoma xenopodis]|uniref:Uncharacterized protein n=1 Tax=Protopolystoma xenopodis TaxID=117903 RepID=A0A448WZI0_9PLAT|nr:unnamed protein product [Protopolystoma xenopodis]
MGVELRFPNSVTNPTAAFGLANLPDGCARTRGALTPLEQSSRYSLLSDGSLNPLKRRVMGPDMVHTRDAAFSMFQDVVCLSSEFTYSFANLVKFVNSLSHFFTHS